MVGKLPWVWHDFKIRLSPDGVAEVTALSPEQFWQLGGLVSSYDNQQPAAKWCRTNKRRPVNRHRQDTASRGKDITKKIKLWCQSTAKSWKWQRTEQFCPSSKTWKTTQSWMSAQIIANSQKVQNTSRHLINSPSILPTTREQHAVKGINTNQDYTTTKE